MKLFQIPGEGPDFKPSLTLKVLWFASDVSLWTLWLFCLIASIFSEKVAVQLGALFIVLFIPAVEIKMYIMEKRYGQSNRDSR